MDILIPVWSIIGGFFVALLLVSRVGRWVATIYEIVKDQSASAKAATVASAAVLSSAPWLLVLAVVLAYQLRAESWMLWVTIGFGAGLLFCSLLVYRFARKRPAAGKGDAA